MRRLNDGPRCYLSPLLRRVVFVGEEALNLELIFDCYRFGVLPAENTATQRGPGPARPAQARRAFSIAFAAGARPRIDLAARSGQPVPVEMHPPRPGAVVGPFSFAPPQAGRSNTGSPRASRPLAIKGRPRQADDWW